MFILEAPAKPGEGRLATSLSTSLAALTKESFVALQCSCHSIAGRSSRGSGLECQGCRLASSLAQALLSFISALASLRLSSGPNVPYYAPNSPFWALPSSPLFPSRSPIAHKDSNSGRCEPDQPESARHRVRLVDDIPDPGPKVRALADHINMRILPAMVSGIPLLWSL